MTLYAARGTNQTTSNLYTVDTSTGVLTSVGTIGRALTGLAWDETTETMFGAVSNNSTVDKRKLVTVDLVTGAGSLVGAYGGTTLSFGDIACDSEGNLYGWASAFDTNGGLYSIDKSTGVATWLGGNNPGNSGCALAFDFYDNLWLFPTGGGSADRIYSVDPITGTATPGVLLTGDTPGSNLNAAAIGPDGLLYVTRNSVGGSPPPIELVLIGYPDGFVSVMTTLAVFGVDGISFDASPGRPVSERHRVLIAPSAGPFDDTQDWVPLDDVDNLVSRIEIHRGRQTELDQTDTSTATIFINDTDGSFDPDSPAYGTIDGKQIRINLQNPVTGNWVQQWQGWIHDITYDLHPATENGISILSNVQIECVDLFEYLARVEMIPGVFGDPAPDAAEGTVFYENGPVDDRIVSLLTDADVPSFMQVVFTGNIDVPQTQYDPGDPVLVALRDACDAEFPGIANCYTDKRGYFVFHGRKARFDPEGTAAEATPGAWNFTRWKAGDGAAIEDDGDRAQIRPPMQWRRPRSRIINAAIAYPRGIDERLMPGQVAIDAGSVTSYGYRSWSARDLIIAEGTTTGNTAAEECRLFADFYVANYSAPRTRVEAITFKSIEPTDPRAAPTWALICNADISDIIDFVQRYPGTSSLGLAENFYIEGSSMTIVPLNTEFDFVEVTFNVSPEANYGDDVGMIGT